MQKLYLVIPCYNEEEVLPETSKQLRAKMETLMAAGKISKESRIVFVNDGSKDRTWEIIESLHKENPLFQGIKLSRNKGHQNALLAGLMTVKEHCDMAISMDADLQDDIDAIDACWKNTPKAATLSMELETPEIQILHSNAKPQRDIIK